MTGPTVAPPRGAIILADGDVPSRRLLDEAWPDWADGTELVVAADGGAQHAAGLDLAIDLWVGDGDSVDAAQLALLEAGGVRLHRVPTDKDATDTELAIEIALGAGAHRLAIVGALGGARLDHALANVLLLATVPAGVDAVLYDGRASRISLMAAPDRDGLPVGRSFTGRMGDIVSLIPIDGAASGVTTQGLRFPLAGEALELGRTRGVSNVRTAESALVGLESGRLLVIETPVTVGR